MLTNLAIWIQEFQFIFFSSSVPSSVSSYFRYGLPVVRCITFYEHFSGSLPFLRLVRLLLFVAACLLSTYRSLVTVVEFCLSVQVWLLCVRYFPRALLRALHASLRGSEAAFAFPSFIEDFLSAVMEARILGAVLRAESKVQCRFSTALPQFVTAANVGQRVPSASWPLALSPVYQHAAGRFRQRLDGRRPAAVRAVELRGGPPAARGPWLVSPAV